MDSDQVTSIENQDTPIEINNRKQKILKFFQTLRNETWTSIYDNCYNSPTCDNCINSCNSKEEKEETPQQKNCEEKTQKNFKETELKIILLSENAYIPSRATPESAGLDLQSAYDYILLPHNKILIKTDIVICLPEGTYGRIASRSSIAYNLHIDVGAGVIDADYRGNILVLLFNHSNENVHIRKGDKIAQLIVERIMYPTIKIVEHYKNTERDDHGFGIEHTADL